MEKASMPRPVAVKAWSSLEKMDKGGPHKPFKYLADALCGLALIRLNPNLKCPVSRPGANAGFCDEAWQALDPHWELWQRAQDRVQSLHGKSNKVDARTCADFEKRFNGSLEHAMTPQGLDLKDLWALIDTVNDLESRKNSPLLYNFGLKFTPQFVDRLHALYSFLFHLRSIVAVDWNAHVDDATHEAVKVDSITDYVPKAEYVVNDALLYWHFKKLSQPFVAGRNSDVKVEKLLVEPLRSAFNQTSHNACCLIDQLPASFLEKMGPADLEEALYHVQMDWLLGSPAGLLFRIREELYGLQNGYDRIFWRDVEDGPKKKPFNLSLCFELRESDWRVSKAA
ncbi:MAG: hypothetical protein KF865_05505 [Bdellovibrionaceae bacterium]|nr:hypothetical protein [Pseudobdellovibrionaceae bacterium]